MNRNRHVPWSLLLAVGLATTTAGCGSSNLSRTFGLTRDAPDEFTVTTQAPLSMPPDFNLRPPRPGVPRPQQTSESRQAEEALVPQMALTGPVQGPATAGQAALVQAAGPPAPANIRRQVDMDAKLAQADESFLDKVLYWRKPETQNVMVDPTKESQRLRQNAALGESPTVGETATIKPKNRGILGPLLDWF
ncbi:MAG: DUF3035 domain-containing protein [Acetobacteraceae bacterium]